MKDALVERIPRLAELATTRQLSQSEYMTARSSRMDLVGPRIALAAVAETLNDLVEARPFREAFLGFKTDREIWRQYIDQRLLKVGVLGVGQENDHLAVGTYIEGLSAFFPAVVIGREDARTANPRLRLMRQDPRDGLQLLGTYIESATEDQVIEGFLNFLTLEPGDRGLIESSGYFEQTPRTNYARFKPLFGRVDRPIRAGEMSPGLRYGLQIVPPNERL